MTTTNPISNLYQLDWSRQDSSGLDSSAASSGLSFLSLLQTGMMGNMTSGLDSLSSGGSFFQEMMFVLLAQVLGGESQDQNPAGWRNFPSPQMNTQGMTFLNPYGGGSLSLYPQNIPAGPPVVGSISQGVHEKHIALDYSVVVGTPVKTTLDGAVKTVGFDPDGYGNYVVVENGPYEVYYAHLSNPGVSVGDQVWAGQVIGLSGNTGNSTGPHLHYEIRKAGTPVDPRQYV